MHNILRKVKAILKGKRGESLIEGIVSILVFTVLIAAVTMMIMISLRITGISTANADIMQKESNAVLAGADTIPADTKTIEFVVNDNESDLIKIGVSVYTTDNYTAFEPN